VRNTPDIWVENLERGTNVRVTTAVEPDLRPVWSPDGRYLAYVSGNLPFRTGKRILSVARADGTGVVRTFPCPGEYCEPTDWTSRGLLVNVLGPRDADVWIVPVEDGTPAQPLLTEKFTERDARLSRDGRWVAYVSDESGRPEVSVRRVSGPPKRIPISGEGGDHPVWRADGAELFFVDPEGQLRSVPVQWNRDGLPTFGLPAKMSVPRIGVGHWGTPYDVSPDGSRIYLLRGNDDPPPHELHVVIGGVPFSIDRAGADAVAGAMVELAIRGAELRRQFPALAIYALDRGCASGALVAAISVSHFACGPTAA
jgi:serine/threonine-protein kinase